MKKIVTIGGGSGQHELLTHLKTFNVTISTIVSMMDDGGSTGRLREAYGVLPPGDIRRCLVALAQDNTQLAKVMEYRFATGDLVGHTVGNIMLSGFSLQAGTFQAGIDALSTLLKIRGQVLPVTFDQAQLSAKLVDGTIITGETNIDIPKHDSTIKIDSVFLTGNPHANPRAVEAITQADLVILTIGDMYTSLIPNLLISDIAQAIHTTVAPVVYTCNQTNKVGETDGFTASDYITTLERYLQPGDVDYIIVNQASRTAPDHTEDDMVARYDQAALTAQGVQVIETDLGDAVTIDGKKLAQSLIDLCKQL